MPQGQCRQWSRKCSGSYNLCSQRCTLHSLNLFLGRTCWWLETQLNLRKPQLGCQASSYCPQTGSFLSKEFQTGFLSVSADNIGRLETLTPNLSTTKTLSDIIKVPSSGKSLSHFNQIFSDVHLSFPCLQSVSRRHFRTPMIDCCKKLLPDNQRDSWE